MTLVAYAKPHLTIHEQIALLKQRGMLITDDLAAEHLLDRVGYYRLSGYWYPMREGIQTVDANGKTSFTALDQFKYDSRLEHVAEIYAFDKKLRLILADAIERLEVATRVHVAHMLGARCANAHRNIHELGGQFTKKVNYKTGNTHHNDWLIKLNKNESRSRDEFIKHFNNKYIQPIPLWMSIEVWEFGTLSILVSGLKYKDKENLSNKFNIPDSKVIQTWMRNLNYLRNIAAHHSRLWNISMIEQPKIPKLGEIPLLDDMIIHHGSSPKIYSSICIIQYLLKTISPNSNWGNRLKTLIDEFPSSPHYNIEAMGFPKDWDKTALWA